MVTLDLRLAPPGCPPNLPSWLVKGRRPRQEPRECNVGRLPGGGESSRGPGEASRAGWQGQGVPLTGVYYGGWQDPKRAKAGEVPIMSPCAKLLSLLQP